MSTKESVSSKPKCVMTDKYGDKWVHFAEYQELKAKLDEAESMVREDEKAILIHVDGMKTLVIQRDKAEAELAQLKKDAPPKDWKPPCFHGNDSKCVGYTCGERFGTACPWVKASSRQEEDKA